MIQELKQLKKWLEKNNKAWLAWKLDYDNTAVIDGWLRTRSIPRYQMDRLLVILNESKGDVK